MARATGRQERLDLSAHLWADEDGKLYAYQPSSGLRLRPEGADELHLNPERGRRLAEARPTGGNFSHALGRAGVDARVPDGKDCADEGDVIFTHYQPPVHSRPPPRYQEPSVADLSVFENSFAEVSGSAADAPVPAAVPARAPTPLPVPAPDLLVSAMPLPMTSPALVVATAPAPALAPVDSQ